MRLAGLYQLLLSQEVCVFSSPAEEIRQVAALESSIDSLGHVSSRREQYSDYGLDRTEALSI